MYKGIILDCDGVILNSEKLHLKAINEAYGKYGIFFTEKEYYSIYSGLSDKDSLRRKLQHDNIKFDDKDIKDLVQLKRSAYIKNLTHLKELPFIPGVEDYIKRAIKEGITLGVCSGSSREEVLIALNRLDNGFLFKHFKTIVTIDDLVEGKPNPEGYSLACKNIGQDSNQCLAIEDSPSGVKAAVSAGLSVYALLTTHKSTQLKEANKIYNTFDEILKN